MDLQAVRVYDPGAGTGGMLTITEAALQEHNSSIRVELYVQELNAELFSICKSDMLVTGHNPGHIAYGNTLTDNVHAGETRHFFLTVEEDSIDRSRSESQICRRLRPAHP